MGPRGHEVRPNPRRLQTETSPDFVKSGTHGCGARALDRRSTPTLVIRMRMTYGRAMRQRRRCLIVRTAIAAVLLGAAVTAGARTADAARVELVRFGFTKTADVAYTHGETVPDWLDADGAQNGVVVSGNAVDHGSVAASAGMLTATTMPGVDSGTGMAFGSATCTERTDLAGSPVRCSRQARVNVPDPLGALSPGTGDFSFGAVIRLTRSPAPAPDPTGGMNVFQKGNFSNEDMWKLSVDNGVPGCFIRSELSAPGANVAYAKANFVLDTSTTYKLTCSRSSGVLKLSVADAATGERLATVYASVPSRCLAVPAPSGCPGQGRLDFSDSAAVNIGSKGATRDNPDQLRDAVVDGVWYASGA